MKATNLKSIAKRNLAAVLFLSAYETAGCFSMNDIAIWASTGSKKAAVAIEWRSPEVFNNTSVAPPSASLTLVWGYRFDGARTAKDMMQAIVAADPRLYVVSGYGGGFVFGIGYDLNNDGLFSLTNGSQTYTGSQIRSGNTDALNPDAFNVVDSNDLYWGGLFGPNWELWTEVGQTGGFFNQPDRGPQPYWTPDDLNNPWSGKHGEWEFAQFGIGDLGLKDGSWIGWSVAAGGLEYGNDNAPGTRAWYYHKAAPGLAQAVPEPVSLSFVSLMAVGALLRRRQRRS